MSLVQAILENVEKKPNDVAFSFVKDSPTITHFLTNEELVKKALAALSNFEQHSKVGDRVLLVLENSEAFMCAFVACLLGGRIAVGCPRPIFGHHMDRIAGIINDCEPSIVVHQGQSDTLKHEIIQSKLANVKMPAFINSGAMLLAHSDATITLTNPQDIALLQYTSGSTNTPKGVMVSHGNLSQQCQILDKLFAPKTDSKVVSWMPVFHDFGLIAGVVYPLCRGLPSTIFSPYSFVKDPLLWLQVLSAQKADLSASPNFGFEHCLKKLERDSVSDLSLGHVRCLLNGGEPVRAETLQRFESELSRFGLKKHVARPVYGLAEATLAIAGFPLDDALEVRTLTVDAKALCRDEIMVSQNKISTKTFVSSGPVIGHDVRIINPSTRQQTEDGVVGEIWVADGSVALGYWLQPAATEEFFQAKIHDESTSFLRTGDLGFFLKGELYVCGRLKDTMIINGTNIHPNDVEDSLQKNETNLRGAMAACFSFDDGAHEQVIILQEVPEFYRDKNLKQLAQRIFEIVAQSHDFRPYEVLLIKRGIPRTSSGKVMRSNCRKMYLNKEFKTLYILKRESAGQVASFQQEFPEILAATPNTTEGKNQPIAIVGMSCRFPKAKNLKEFWQRMMDGEDCIKPIPADRWNGEALYDAHPLASGKTTTQYGGFIDNVEQFDREFFNLSVREATRMDPQHRLLLELSWHALEDACIIPNSLRGTRTGVFVGISGSDYAQAQFSDELVADAYAGLGSALTLAASRVSHFFDFRGPALAIDTACSSSLSAVHMACQSILAGESDQSLACGVNLVLSPMINMCLSKAGMMSPDGRCKTFDASANGYVRAEGAGVVLLKPLAKALADGDSIYGVIAGSASNQDGGLSGISVPNGKAQQEVVTRACAKAGIMPKDLTYVEAHGTGTAVGDPIEINALGEIIKSKSTSLLVGSLKTNFGHAESAAGIAGLIKGALILRHKQIPPNLHFINPNPLIDFAALNIEIPTVIKTLTKQEQPMTVGVNSFGVGGTNVHVVLREHSAAEVANVPQIIEHEFAMLPFFAHCEKSLKAKALQLSAELESGEKHADLLKTNIDHRAILLQRACVFAPDLKSLSQALHNYGSSGDVKNIFIKKLKIQSNNSQKTKIALIFSGQGMQWVGMGSRLFKEIPFYRERIRHIAGMFTKELSGTVLKFFQFNSLAAQALQKTDLAQPIMFTLQAALFDLLSHWGVQPSAVVGHSMGEVSAAYAAGILSLKDAVQLISVRGKLMESLAGQGLMANIELGSLSVAKVLNEKFPDACVAAINGPTSTVISGSTEAVSDAISYFKEDKITSLILPGKYAFHSPFIDAISTEFKHQIKNITFKQNKIPLLSTVHGGWVESPIDADYWVSNMREPVAFAPAIEKLCAEGFGLFIEVGPHTILSPMIDRVMRARNHVGHSISTLRKNTDCLEQFLAVVSKTYVEGSKLNWAAFQTVGKPLQMQQTYPFNCQSYWLNVPSRYDDSLLRPHNSLTKKINVKNPTWECAIEQHLSQHSEYVTTDSGTRLSHGVALELALASIQELHPSAKHIVLRDMTIHHALSAASPTAGRIQISHHENRVHVTQSAFDSKITKESPTWIENLTLDYQLHDDEELAVRSKNKIDIQDYTGSYQEKNHSVFYAKLDALGYKYDRSLKVIANLWAEGSQILAKIQPVPVEKNLSKPLLSPFIFEGIEQLFLTLSNQVRNARLINYGILNCSVHDLAAAYILAQMSGDGHLTAFVTDAEGQIIAEIQGAKIIETEQDALTRISENAEDWLYEHTWLEKSLESVNRVHATYVVFAQDCGYSRACLEHLKKSQEGSVYEINPGDKFQLSGHIAEIKADEDAHFVQLLENIKHIKNSSTQHFKIIWMWPLRAMSLASGQDHLNAQYFGTLGLVKLLRALRTAGISENQVDIFVVFPDESGRAGEVFDNEALCHSTLVGFARTLDIELPEVTLCRIQIAGENINAEAKNLIREITSAPVDKEILLRGSMRLVRRLKNITASATPLIESKTDLFETTMILQKHLSRWLPAISGGRMLVIDPLPDQARALCRIAETHRLRMIVLARKSNVEILRTFNIDSVIDINAVDVRKQVQEFSPEGFDLIANYNRHLGLGLASYFVNQNSLVVDIFLAGESETTQVNKSVEHILSTAAYSQLHLAKHKTIAVDRPRLYNLNGTYVITGGLGGLGVEVGKRMARHGAGHIVLLTRRKHDLDNHAGIKTMRRYGARVSVEVVRVELEAEVASFFARLATDSFPVRGVIHAAGVLANGLVHEMSDAQFLEPMAAKIAGSLNIMNFANNPSLKFLILFSSLASSIGSRGQSNYAAGNAFMDGLAAQSQQMAAQVLSVSWGPWAEKGMAAQGLNESRLKASGFGFIPLEKGLDLLEEFIATKRSGAISVLPMNWGMYGRVFPAALEQGLVKDLIPEIDVAIRSENSVIDAMPPLADGVRCQLYILEILRRTVAQCFCVALQDLDAATELRSLGFDSIISLELKARIEAQLSMRISTSFLLDGPTLEALAAHCLERLRANVVSETLQQALISVSEDLTAKAREIVC